MENKIILIYPYFKTKENINQKLFPPLGIAFLSAQLKKRALEVIKIDCTFERFEDVVKKVINLNPKIIGFYTMVSLSKNTYDLLKEFKIKLPNTLFICGGPQATLFPQIFIQEFDLVFKGELHEKSIEFLQNYINSDSNKKDFLNGNDCLSNPGICFKSENGIVQTIQYHLTSQEIKNLPLPDRSEFNHQQYQEFWEVKEGIRMTSIITTFGCPFSCDFCSKPIFGNLFRKRNSKDVIEEIEQIKSLGYDYLWISDDCFSLDIPFLLEICNKLIERKLNIKWCCLSRVDKLNINIVKKMKEAGCDKIYMGLESGNNQILKLMNKNMTIEESKTAVKILRKIGIKSAGFFIVGYPGETWKTIDETFKFASRLKLDEVSFNVPFPLPGSKLFEKVANVDPKKDWSVENEITFVYDSGFDEHLLKQKILNFYNHTKINYAQEL